MADLHCVTFEWPYGSANNVIVTGTFDHWSSSVRLDKQDSDSSFKAKVKVPWSEKVAYKFIVDGVWLVNEREPTERDPVGNLNNIYVAPPKPAEPSHLDSAVKPERALEKVEKTPAEQPLSADGGKDVSPPQILSDLAQIVAATQGTASAVEYVASGVGAGIQGVSGVDLINATKIPVQTPKVELVETSAVDASTATNHIEERPVQPVKAVGVSSNVDVTTNGVPALNVLPVVSSVDSTLSPPPKEVITAHGPSTHTPVGISNSLDPSSPTVSDIQAETPIAGSLEVLKSPAAKSSPPIDPLPNTQDTTTTALTSGKETNENNTHPTSGSTTMSTPTSRTASPAPSTPTRFPSTISPKSDKSPSSSRFRTISTTGSIKKSLAGLRVSIKGIFGGGRHKEV